MEKQVFVYRINESDIPDIDGHLNEPIWSKPYAISDFIQKDPVEGGLPSDSISIVFLYDKHALYIGAKMLNKSNREIRTTVSRRDNAGNSERLKFSIDSYRDLRTAYTFGVTASGVRIDYYHASDNEYNRDHSFDPVWEAETSIDNDGWTAEIRIPLSQIRFNDLEEQEWGLNINWWIPSKREDNYWVLVPKNETGWSSRMGKMSGIQGIKPSKRIELLPYISGIGTLNPAIDDNDPYRDEFDANGRVGIDLKMGLGPNITLDATINPDFGQVEADPAVVNLSAYETYYDEKRPFFTESKKLIEGNGHNYFYSRRIGAPPKGNIDGDFTYMPDNTGILGAAKISGRTNSGLSIGAMSALTGREYGKSYDMSDSSTTKIEVEPLTSYNVVRMQQEFGPDASTFGVSLTGAKRFMEENSELDKLLNRDAVTGGADWNIRFNKGEFEFEGYFGFSHVNASKDAMLDLQTSSAHYFQRPDASHVSIDSNMTSLTGFCGEIEFSKNAGEHWLWELSANFESPGLELNDMGRLQSADDLGTYAMLQYRDNVPGDYFHAYSTSFFVNHRWNFGGTFLHYGLNSNTNLTFLDRSSINLFLWGDPPGLDDAMTRGGPIMGIGSQGGGELNYSSDWSSNTAFNINAEYFTRETGGYFWSLSGNLSIRTGGRLELSIRPNYSYRIDSRQYFDTYAGGREVNYFNRYVFSYIERSTLSTRFRVNYAFNPDLTLEIYAEPFASSGRYYNFGELEKPGSKNIVRYGIGNSEVIRDDDGNYTVSDDTGSFSFDNPDFNVLSFRSNVVLRWEWTPGSTFYLVWQQGRYERIIRSNRVKPGYLYDALVSDGINTIALKVSYWLPID